jgi:aryl-alcohol dehydrogenase-like predicted oxidoreductase
MVIEKTFACMKAAYDAGINFFDTAVGKAIKHFGWKQRDLVISTKVPFSSPYSLSIKLLTGAG